MTTMEKLFVQIFERKKRVIEQVKHQIDLFDHHLASICLLDGIAPPSWLLSPSFPSISSDLNEMKREELISGLLLQHSQSANPNFSSHYSVYQEPIVTARNEGLPNASCTEVYASNNDTNAVDRLSVLPSFPIDDTQCSFNGVPELDGSVTSPPYCADARISRLSVLPSFPIDDTQCSFNGVPELDGSVKSPPYCADARISDNCQDPAQSLVKIQRSKSRQRALELRNSAKANKLKSCEENTAGAHTSQNARSRINPLQYDHFDELMLVKHVDANNENFGEKSKNIECAGKEKNCDIDYDRTIRSGSCSQQIGFVNETGNDGDLSYIGKKGGLTMSSNFLLPPSGCVIGLSESFDPSALANSSSGAEANLVDCRGNKKNSIVCYAKMAESRTSVTPASIQKEPFEAGNTCVAEVDDGDIKSLEKSAKHTSSNNELLEPSPVISNKSSKARKANRRDKGIKEKDSNIYVARITRSRSSHQHINCMNECLELDNSHSNGKENGVSKTKQLSDDAHDLMELVKPLDTTYVSGEVRAVLKDCEKVDAENSASGCRITSSSSSKKINDFNEFPKVDISSGTAMHGDGVLLQSLGRSSQPPQRSSFVEERVNLQIPSGIQLNVLPPSESIMAANVTDIYFNGIGETCSVNSKSKSNSDSAGCGVERSESRPPSECAMVMKAKQLDFDDVEESSLFKSFNLELENKEEGITEKQLSPLLDDSQEKPSTSIEMPLQKQQEDSSKQEKVRKDSSEANLKDNADLVEERSFKSAEQVVGSDESRPGITETQISPLLDDSQEKPSTSIEMPLQKQQEDSSKQEKVRKDSPEANLKDYAGLVEERAFNSAAQVVDSDESRPPSECAIVMKAKQLDFDNVEESSLFMSFKLALENKQDGITEKRLSPLWNDSQEKPSISIEMPLQKQQEDSSNQEKVRKDSSEANLKDNADLVEERSFNSAQQVVGSDESRSPSALAVKATQLDFDDVEESSMFKSFKLALENKQEAVTENRLSLLLNDSQEKPSIYIEMPLQKQQEDSSKQEKVRNDSPEANLKDVADLAEERSFNSAQQVAGTFISRSQSADFFSMGSWPQHKRMKIGSQLTISLSPSLKINPCQPFNKYDTGDAIQSDAITSPVDDAAWNVEHQNIEESEISLSKLHGHEVAINLEGKSGVNALTPILEQAVPTVASLKKLEAGFSPGCLLDKPEVADPNSTVFDVTRQHTAEDNQVLLQDSYTEDTIQERKYHFGWKDSLSHLSSGSPHSLSLVGTDQHMPEYEGFFVESDAKLPCTINEGIDFDKLDLPPIALSRARVLDQFCKSSSVCTPLSHSTAYESHEALNLYHSIPNGLLEGMELMNMLSMDGDESKLISSSYSCLNEGVDNDLHSRSQSVSLLFSNAQSAWDISKPCMSPVGKFWDGMPPKSGSSGKRVSSIPELPCISEENENTDGIADTLLESICPQVDMSLVKRDPLADITRNSNPLTSVCIAEIQDDRSSIASVNTELGLTGTCDRGRKRLRDHNKRRFTSKDKENQNISLGGDGVKRGKGSVHSRFSKPKLSEKASLRKGGPSLFEKESKRTNIVSNITSFVPLVQQKQAAAAITGKRDIKVKSLEAAEAAKRLAEKKENERKMRKEALKIERAKMEETNLRQLELEKKKKEEEKKKKDADMAAKKRQREEEERKEKVRKRMRTEEAKRNHVEYEKKLQIEKEEREVKFQATDERACNRKEPKKYEKAKVDNSLRTVPGTKPPTIEVSTIGTINANISVEDHEAFSGDNSKVMGFFGKPSGNNSLVSNVSQEQSYDISPYKGSDDEDEDEDENMQNNKYKPSWASKDHLALVVSSQQRIDPESIFPPDSFCSISEVLLPRRLQQI
ncbi:uncharacterized protein [Euphorbia lathyris]|uniref:uncharacterized protein n=1 Tax=Euphorbia lathyris TaxID=212925 RepID=UPI00331314CB